MKHVTTGDVVMLVGPLPEEERNRGGWTLTVSGLAWWRTATQADVVADDYIVLKPNSPSGS